MAVTGSAVMGVGDNGTDTTSKMESYITFTGTGETSSGLSFGLSATLGNYAPLDGGYADDGTSVYVKGAFGTLTMGDVAEADEVATLSDIGGIGGLGVDDVAEAFSGDSVGKFADAAVTAFGGSAADGDAVKAALGSSHDLNYTYSADAFTLSASTRLTGSGDAFALGGKYSFGNAYVGLGYNEANYGDLAAVATALDVVGETVDDITTKATSVYAGGTFGNVALAAMYTDFGADMVTTDTAANPDVTTATSIDGKAYGLTAAYTMDATTISAAYSKLDLDGVKADAYGIGASYDLGGGAAVNGGIARNASDETVWEAGMSFSF